MSSTRFDPRQPLHGDLESPLYRQIYERFRHGIAQGLLKPGDRIPSARALAKELGVARGTVEVAYALLCAEGYTQARGQAGTVVNPGLQLESLAPASAAKPAPAAKGEEPIRRSPGILPFQLGLPALDAFPRKLWARLGAKCLRVGKAADLAYPPDQGLPSLRAAIASYLQVARGIRCDPGQVFITAGYRSTLDLIARALLEPGDRAWVEDPGYPPTRRFLGHAGMVPVPVPVDGEGIVVPRGVELADDARIAVVTPAHQSPLCVSLSLPRRQALLGWAQRRQAWIVEDDYDGEYRYVGRPLPALKSLDRDGRVLYAGTFSKVLFPGVRLAYLVVPEAQIETFRRASRIFQDGVPRTTQSIVSAFIDEGHFARHIQRMRRLYAERRALAAQGLAGTLPAGMRVEPQPGGMHLVVRLRAGQDDERLAARLFEHGMGAHPLSPWYASAAQSQALLLGFTNIGSLDEAERLGRRIARLA